MFGRSRKVSEHHFDVTLRDQVIPVTVRRNPRARRIILRLDPAQKGAVVTLPTYARDDEALAMVEAQTDWLLARLNRLPEHHPFIDGATVPYLGDDYVVRHVPGRKPVSLHAGEIGVSGAPEHLARRLTDWFKAEARREISALADQKTAILDVKRGRISIRDTRSRWGSCAVNGNLSFSWRLVMAPVHVLDYVVAHEVAHIRHHDHSPAFWRTVTEATDHTDQAKAWLNSAGPKLHLYG